MFRIFLPGHADGAAATGSGARRAQAPAPALPAHAIRTLFDDVLPQSAREDLHDAMQRYFACGPAPNIDCLRAMRSAIVRLKVGLADSDAFYGTTTCDQLFDRAEAALLIDGTKLAAPQLLLSHLERTLKGYRSADDDLRMDRTPEVYVALTRYVDLLDARCPDILTNGRRAGDAFHEALRTLMFAPRRQRIVRDFARRAEQPDGPGLDVLAHLGIPRDYRATDQDRREFRALFESGRILRHRMVYTPPAECRALYRQYEHEVGQAMRQDARAGANLHDLIAVRTYTVSSNELNQALRDGDTTRIAQFAPMIKLLVSGLAQLRRPPCSVGPDKDGFYTLLRAVEMSEQDILHAGYVAGATFRQPTPMSCTEDPHATFWTMRNKYNVHIRVRCKNPCRVGEISRHAHSEAEWILALQTWFEVTHAAWRSGGSATRPWLDLTIEERDPPPTTRSDKA